MREEQTESTLRSRLRTIEQERAEMERSIQRCNETMGKQRGEIQRRYHLCEGMAYGLEQDTELRKILQHNQEIIGNNRNQIGMIQDGMEQFHHKKRRQWSDSEEEIYQQIRKLQR